MKQAILKSPKRMAPNCGKYLANENKEIGSTEIISKYNNYPITKIVTNFSGNEETDISKITREVLEDIIGGNVFYNRHWISEKDIHVKQETECDTGTTFDPGDSNKSVYDVKIHARECYVRLEYNQMIEYLQNNAMNAAKTGKVERNLDLKNSKHNAEKGLEFIPTNNKKSYKKECYVKIRKDPVIENMHIPEIEVKNIDRDISKFCEEKCDKEQKKLLTEYNTNKLSCTCLGNENSKGKRLKSYNMYQNKTSPAKMRKHEREHDILLYENLRLENSLSNAIKKNEFLEWELSNLKKHNYYTSLKNCFQEDEINALLENTSTDWNNKMITKAIQLRFACGNDGYEELLKDFHLPSLKILRNKVQNSQFDVVSLANVIVQF